MGLSVASVLLKSECLKSSLGIIGAICSCVLEQTCIIAVSHSDISHLQEDVNNPKTLLCTCFASSLMWKQDSKACESHLKFASWRLYWDFKQAVVLNQYCFIDFFPCCSNPS